MLRRVWLDRSDVKYASKHSFFNLLEFLFVKIVVVVVVAYVLLLFDVVVAVNADPQHVCT